MVDFKRQYKKLKEENKQLKNELQSLKRKMPNKDWFITTEKLKLDISDYTNNILFFLTILLTVVIIKPNPVVLSPNLKIITIGILGFIAWFNWNRNNKFNKLAKHFNERKKVESFLWKYGTTFLVTMLYICLIVLIWFNYNWIAFIIMIIGILYILLRVILWWTMRT